MARRKRFTDNAGYTRHCWECMHAKQWEKRPINGDRALCDVTGAHVYKFDSPNNQCCHLPVTCDYKEEELQSGKQSGSCDSSCAT